MEHRNGNRKQNADYDLQEQLSDFWMVVRRHVGLVIVCLAVGIGLGCLYYLKAPRTYESFTELLIVTEQIPEFSDGGDDQHTVYATTIEQHASIIRSPKIITKAFQEDNLRELKTLAIEENPVDTVIDNLSVRIREENTTILTLNYTGADPADCQTIVNSIAKAYANYLSESATKIGDETARLIRLANEELEKQIGELDETYASFEKSAPLMYRDGQAVNRHYENQIAIEDEIGNKQVARQELLARIEAMEQAIDEGGNSARAVYYAAINELNPEDENDDWRAFQMESQEKFAELETVRTYIRALVDKYVDLMVTEAELQRDFDDGHHELVAVRGRMESIKLLIRKTREEQSPLSNLSGEELEVADTDDYIAIYMQTLGHQLKLLDSEIERLNGQSEAEQQLAHDMQVYMREDQSLRSEMIRKESLYNQVVEKLAEIDLIKARGGDTVDVLADGGLGEQIAPRLLRVLVASTFLGCFAGCVLAWLVDRSENTFRSISEIRHALRVPVIGRIPFMKRSQQLVSPAYPKIAPIVCTVHQESSNLAEAFRGVRTSMYFSTSGQDHKVIQITSPLPGDGKSTIVANLAVSIAKSGKSVLVLDADFRRPSLSKILGQDTDEQDGLAAVVAGKVDPIDAAIRTDVENMYFMPAGKRPHNPSELLSTPEFKDLLDSVRKRYDFVIIDTPPILAVTDPCAVAARVDGVMLAIRIRKGVQVAALRSAEILNNLEANTLGVIVNGAERRFGYGGSRYGYGYGYGDGYGYGQYGDEVDAGVTTGNGNGLFDPRKAAQQERKV